MEIKPNIPKCEMGVVTDPYTTAIPGEGGMLKLRSKCFIFISNQSIPLASLLLIVDLPFSLTLISSPRCQKCPPLKKIFIALFVLEEFKHFETHLFLTHFGG